jgi:hypothetical protein
MMHWEWSRVGAILSPLDSLKKTRTILLAFAGALVLGALWWFYDGRDRA